MLPHVQLITASRPGDLTVGIAQLFELQQGIGIKLLQAAALQQRSLGADQGAELGEEPGIDATEGMNLRIGAAFDHGGPHRQDPVGGRSPKTALQLSGWHGNVGPIAAPSGKTGFKRAQRLLE